MPNLSRVVMIFFGIITGVILASIANDEIIILQASTPVERENAQFYIGIFALSAATISALSVFRIIRSRTIWMDFLSSVSFTVTMVSIVFLTILPKIISWLKV
jgi:hypothetical protein